MVLTSRILPAMLPVCVGIDATGWTLCSRWFSPLLRRALLSALCISLQAAAQDDAREATEKMIVAQMQRDRLRQCLQALDPAAASEATAEADAIANGTSSAGDVVKEQLERIAELEREVKRLKQVSR